MYVVLASVGIIMVVMVCICKVSGANTYMRRWVDMVRCDVARLQPAVRWDVFIDGVYGRKYCGTYHDLPWLLDLAHKFLAGWAERVVVIVKRLD